MGPPGSLGFPGVPSGSLWSLWVPSFSLKFPSRLVNFAMVGGCWGGSNFPNQAVPEGTRGNPREPAGTRGNPQKDVPEGTRGNPRDPEGTRVNPREPERTRKKGVPEGTRGNPREPEKRCSLGFPRVPSGSVWFRKMLTPQPRRPLMSTPLVTWWFSPLGVPTQFVASGGFRV